MTRGGSWIRRAIGTAAFAAGLVLLAPWLLVLTTWESATGAVIVEVLPEPVDEAHVRLAVVFEFPVPDDPAARGFGYGWVGIDGRPADDQVVSTADAGAEIRRLLPSSGTRFSRRVLYDPADPLGSARILTTSGGWRINLGLLCLLTPPALALSSFLNLLLTRALARPRG